MLSSWLTDRLDERRERLFLTHGEERCTYGEVADLAEQVAAVLRDVPTPVVPLLAGRNIISHVLVLGAMLAGKTPAPLPSGNESATRSALSTLGAAGALDLQDVTEPAGEYVSGPALARALRACGLPDHDEQQPGGQDERPELAYVLFTSGSTGVPKGVPVKATSLTAYVDQAVDRFSVTADARLSATFRLNFDVAMHDLFCALHAGASLHLPKGREFLLPGRYIARAGLTHWFSVPSVVRLSRKVRGLDPGSIPDLAVTIFAGEALTVQDLASWQAAAPRSEVHNLYGPTECTIGCFAYRVPDNESLPATSNGTVPIGSPMAGVEFRVGEPGHDTDRGQLLVRGTQRFDGYLGASSRYAPDDWYPTGDIVEWTGTDTLVFVGRTDRQVKLNGHRVELGEVEFLARGCAGVTDARAELDPSGQLTIVCESAEGEEAVRTTLARELPAHMRGRVVVVPAFPLTPNGKTDVRHLGELVAQSGSPDGSR